MEQTSCLVEMGLQNEFDRQGNVLFRWRSFLPMALIPLLVMTVVDKRLPFGSHFAHEFIEYFALGVSFVGLFIRIYTVGHTPAQTSGRNTKSQVAETLNTTGIYSIVRHPLYLGNYLIGLGIVMVPAVWWLVVIYTLSFWLYYERIMFAEEAFLRNRFGEAFSEWAAVTPAFIPNVSLWQKPSLPMSYVNVLKREYTALGLIVLIHGSMEAAEHLLLEHRLPFEPFWTTLILVSLGGYVVLRFLKKNTELLKHAGR